MSIWWDIQLVDEYFLSREILHDILVFEKKDYIEQIPFSEVVYI